MPSSFFLQTKLCKCMKAANVYHTTMQLESRCLVAFFLKKINYVKVSVNLLDGQECDNSRGVRYTVHKGQYIKIYLYFVIF